MTTESEPLGMFLYAIRSDDTKQKYQRKLFLFFDFIGLGGTLEEKSKLFVANAKEKPNYAFASVMKFLAYQKERVERKEISETTIRNYYKPLKLFCEMNDVMLSWKKISRGLPKGRRFANDRAPTIEEIRAIAEYPDRRMKSIVYTMCSSGIRLGSWDYLKWGHVEPVEQNGNVVAAKMVVYAGDEEQYTTFVTPEAYNALKQWMDFREKSGEKITKDSWVMRDLWNVEDNGKGLAKFPKRLNNLGIKRLIERAISSQGQKASRGRTEAARVSVGARDEKILQDARGANHETDQRRMSYGALDRCERLVLQAAGKRFVYGLSEGRSAVTDFRSGAGEAGVCGRGEVVAVPVRGDEADSCDHAESTELSNLSSCFCKDVSCSSIKSKSSWQRGHFNYIFTIASLPCRSMTMVCSFV